MYMHFLLHVADWAIIYGIHIDRLWVVSIHHGIFRYMMRKWYWISHYVSVSSVMEFLLWWFKPNLKFGQKLARIWEKKSSKQVFWMSWNYVNFQEMQNLSHEELRKPAKIIQPGVKMILSFVVEIFLITLIFENLYFQSCSFLFGPLSCLLFTKYNMLDFWPTKDETPKPTRS